MQANNNDNMLIYLSEDGKIKYILNLKMEQYGYH